MVYNVRAKSWKAKQKAFKCRAWLNGVEVTKHCFYADPRRGVVRLFKYGDSGHHYVDPVTGDAATEERHGRVIVRRKRAA